MPSTSQPLSVARTPSPVPWRSYLRGTTLAFWGVHVAAVVGVIACGLSWSGVCLAAGAYFVRMFVVTAAYHRYFSHRTYKTSRWFQFVLASGRERRAEGRDLVGEASPLPPQALRRRETTSTRPAGAGSGSRTSDGSCPDWQETDEKRVPDLRSIPNCAS